jgi:hypothetical protein
MGDEVDNSELNPLYPGEGEYAAASRQFGFDLNLLRTVEAADPRKIVTWSGQWDIRLNSGRQVYVAEWRQYGIYQGMLCGFPRNVAWFLRQAKKEAERTTGDGPIAFLEPTLRKIPVRNDEWADMLPPICTIARLDSGAARGSDEGCFSSLVVVWFQERFGLPYDEDVLDQLRALDWENRAMAWEP